VNVTITLIYPQVDTTGITNSTGTFLNPPYGNITISSTSATLASISNSTYSSASITFSSPSLVAPTATLPDAIMDISYVLPVSLVDWASAYDPESLV
jgi:hypothetical protein